MHALITGGAGFIGSHTVETLLELGVKIRVLDNLSSGSINNLPIHHPRLEIVKGDIRDDDCVTNCMKNITHVLHLAAQVSVPASIEHPVQSHAVNVDGYLNVLNAARLVGVRRIVHASSAAVYGIPITLPLTEESLTAPLSPYGLQKLANDQYAELFTNLYQMSSLGLRYFNVYGPRQDPSSPYSGVISKFSTWALEDAPFTIYGDGMQTRDFIYVKDIARINVAALLSQANGVVNIGTGHSVTLLELVEALEICIGKQIEKRHVTAREGDIPNSSVLPLRMRNELAQKYTIGLFEGLNQLLKAKKGTN